MSQPLILTDPDHYKKVRLPPLEAETLPTFCYTSPQFYALEVQGMFKRSWNFLARADEVPNPGDYKCFELFDEPIVLMRDRSSNVHVFANTCRHRGSQLLKESGNCRVISCPYHAWAYSLSGELVSARGMEKTLNFDRANYGLLPVRFEMWNGFIFVTFDTSCPPLETYLGNLSETVASYRLDDMVCVRRKEYDLSCNWKIYLENAMEEYHTATVHKASIGKQTSMDVDSRGEWDGLYMEAKNTIALLHEDLDSALPQIEGLDRKAADGALFVVIYPNMFFVMVQDCMWWLQEFPVAANRTKVVIGSCFPRSTVARSDFAEKVTKYYRRWDKSLPEDNAISEVQQLGLRSSFSKPGRLSHLEPVVHRIANWMLDRVLARA